MILMKQRFAVLAKIESLLLCVPIMITMLNCARHFLLESGKKKALLPFQCSILPI